MAAVVVLAAAAAAAERAKRNVKRKIAWISWVIWQKKEIHGAGKLDIMSNINTPLYGFLNSFIGGYIMSLFICGFLFSLGRLLTCG